MNMIKTLIQEFAQIVSDGSLAGFLVNIVLAAILASILSRVYIRYGKALSNRRALAANFMLITMTTMLVITVVKSSLALSLGLVGALSIVRFRAAIKEPEELAYLFLSIGIGLALGADQRLLAVVGFTMIVLMLSIRGRHSSVEEAHNLYLRVTSRKPEKELLDQIFEILRSTCSSVQLKRLDKSSDLLEALLIVDIDQVSQLQTSCEQLQQLDDSMSVTFLDNRGI